MKRSLLSLALALAALPAAAESFVYRGSLQEQGAPANGRYDLRLTLLDTRGNTPLLAPVTLKDIEVSDGRFEVPVDFGPFVRQLGAARLQTEVRAGAAPFALIGVAETINLKTLGVGSACWLTDGNPGTDPGLEFIGTTDNQPLVLRSNGVVAGRLQNNQTSSGPGLTLNTANVSFGAPGNSVTTGAIGATISGGGGAFIAVAPARAPNSVTDSYGSVGGGAGNRAGDAAGSVDDARYASIGGGQNNTASGPHSHIGGGERNTALLRHTAVGGGINNSAGGLAAAVGGGENNTAAGDFTSVSGGIENVASAYGASVIGGGSNSASGFMSSVGGGLLNCAGGTTSVALGYRAKVRRGANSGAGGAACEGVALSPSATGDQGSLVWADSQDADFVSTGPNQVLLRAAGGVGINTSDIPNPVDLVVAARSGASGGDPDADFHLRSRSGRVAAIYVSDANGGMTFTTQSSRFALGAAIDNTRFLNTSANGAHLTTGGTWTNGSSRAFKEAFQSIDAGAVLAGVLDLDISRWRYIGSDEGFHIGPMAEDFHALFNTGSAATHIATVDADGVALAAIQGLHAKLEAENSALRERLSTLDRELAALREALLNSTGAAK